MPPAEAETGVGRAVQRSRELQVRPSGVAARSLSQLLDETFGIYGKNLWRFVGIAAVVWVPANVLGLIPLRGVVGSAYAITVAVAALGLTFGAIAHAVGQYYVTNEVSIKRCYSKVWWRAVSVLGATALFWGAIATIASPGWVQDNGVAAGILGLAALVVCVGLIYLAMTIPAVLMESRKPIAAMIRSYELVRGSWWRVLGIVAVFSLVSAGLSLLVSIPFLVAAFLAAEPETTVVLSQAFGLLGAIVASLAAVPVLWIGMTLLYYDLRVRKEDYDIEALTREMGVVAPAPGPLNPRP